MGQAYPALATPGTVPLRPRPLPQAQGEQVVGGDPGRVGQQLVEILLGMQEAPVERVGVPDELLHHSVVVGGEVVLRELPNAALTDIRQALGDVGEMLGGVGPGIVAGKHYNRP
jgi:hypothetical protein